MYIKFLQIEIVVKKNIDSLFRWWALLSLIGGKSKSSSSAWTVSRAETAHGEFGAQWCHSACCWSIKPVALDPDIGRCSTWVEYSALSSYFAPPVTRCYKIIISVIFVAFKITFSIPWLCYCLLQITALSKFPVYVYVQNQPWLKLVWLNKIELKCCLEKLRNDSANHFKEECWLLILNYWFLMLVVLFTAHSNLYL